ncbi:MAG: hypothetical protein QF787_17805 [Nitrospinota bacterium]|nr:hypothetical protein [Nitrospinota bacterium]
MIEEGRTFLAQGANLEKPAGQLRKAVEHIKEKSGLRLIRASSSYYLSKPVGPVSQTPFVDIDLLFFGDWIIESPAFRVPIPGCTSGDLSFSH